MLVLTRRIGEKIAIGDDTFLIVRSISGGHVRLAVQAPSQTRILRGELTVRANASTAGTGLSAQKIVSDNSIVAPLRDLLPLNRVKHG